MRANLTKALSFLACLMLVVPLSRPAGTVAQEEADIIRCECISEDGTVALEFPANGGAVIGTFETAYMVEDRSPLDDGKGSAAPYLEKRAVQVTADFAGTYSPQGSPTLSLQLSGSAIVDIDNLENDTFDRSYRAALDGTATGELNDDGSITIGGIRAQFALEGLEAEEIPNTRWLDPPPPSMPRELTLSCASGRPLAYSWGAAEPPDAPAASLIRGPPIMRGPPKPPKPPPSPPQPPEPPPAPPPIGECGSVQVIYLDDVAVALNEVEIDAFIEKALEQGGPDLSLIISHRQSLVDRFGQQGFDQVDVLLNDLGNIAETCPFILIVGDPDIVPYAVVPNPTDDGDLLYTDDVYGDSDHDPLGMPDIPVARIPDGWSLDLLVAQLSPSHMPEAGDFTLANAKRPHADGVATQIFGIDRVLLWSLPTRQEQVDVSQVDVRYGYYMLHGGSWDTSVWWGEEEVYPDAFTVAQASSQGIVLSGACYGSYTFGRTPAGSITLSFLESGARAFVGSTGITYSPVWTSGPNPTGPIRHDAVFHEAFLGAVSRGQAPLAAFMEAKGEMADLCSTADATPAELKMLHEFIYFGKP